MGRVVVDLGTARGRERVRNVGSCSEPAWSTAGALVQEVPEIVYRRLTDLLTMTGRMAFRGGCGHRAGWGLGCRLENEADLLGAQHFVGRDVFDANSETHVGNLDLLHRRREDLVGDDGVATCERLGDKIEVGYL